MDPTDLYVVGIGASAGGLDAIERFFDHLPKGTGLAFVLVQHLSPDFKSLMDELLARHTELPIHLVQDGMRLEADHIYLIPPKKEMIVSEGCLLLSERDRVRELTLPIDTFFRSLAQDCGAHGIAIVLSGGGSDGSRGIRDVHDAGGLVLVQDLESAQFDGMPKTASEAGVADFVLPPEAMPKAVLDYARTGQHPKRRAQVAERAAPEGLGPVYAMLESEFGIDFTHYKPTTIIRRIERRLQLSQASNVDAYMDSLVSGRDELDSLYRDLLIGVTHFFRNQKAFELLERKILPELLREGSQDVPLRVWVAGCATGEEAYSLAILLNELTDEGRKRPFKIFATDVHRGSLEIAARATYDEQAVSQVSPERLERFFLRRGDGYQLVPDLRQSIVFAPHNVIKDAPFTRVDLISCRNLLIYLQTPAQQRVLSLFHFALNRGGIVLLGPSESMGHVGGDFETVDKHWRIYRKHSDARMPVDTGRKPGKSDPRAALTAPTPSGRPSLTSLIGTYDALLADFMPPSLLLNERGELVHSFGGASRFLRPRDGRQALDVLDMVDAELRMVLGGGVPRALKSADAIVFKGVQVPADGDPARYRVTLKRVESRPGASPHILVQFDAMEGSPPKPPRIETEIDLEQVSREQLGTLESELSSTKQHLNSAIEQLESSNEELQASNEELQASNEELQSTNEELQSVNEELYTVNAEYQRKIGELTEVTNDMDNLLSSTEVGTIFLDKELRIRKFTPEIGETFNLLPTDVGRSLDSFTHGIDRPALASEVRRVLVTGEASESEVRDRGGRAFFLRILPYRAKGACEGVVITLIDVSTLKAAEDALFHERYLLNSLLDNVPDAIYFRDAGGRFIRANRAMADRLGLTEASAAVGKTPFDLMDPDAALALHRQDDEVLQSGQAQHYRLERRVRPGGVEEWDLVTRLPLTDRSQRVVGVIVVFRDVTAEKRAERASQEAVRRRDQFLAMLSHELRNPLSAIVTATALVRRDAVPPEKQGRLLDVLDRQSRQMARLLDDLLDTSRVTQNKIELKRRVLDLRAVVKDAVEAVRPVMDGAKVELTTRVDPRPLYVDGDPARLLQIQINLLNNAAKYTQPGGHVVLAASRDDGHAVVSVRDDGSGIAAEMLDAVFELFVQSNRTLDRSQGGIGVGLTLVRSLVAMHGGTVSAASEGEGKGSEFVVRLPLADGASAEEPVRSRPPVLLARGAKVVVVEDNADSCQVLCELLGDAGFHCQSACDGVSGLALIEAVHPEVAIIDVGLPGMDGFHVAEKVRSNASCPDIFLIALTGYGQTGDRGAAMRAGFDEHLVKPVQVDDLVRLLVKVEDAPDHAALAVIDRSRGL